MWQMPQSKNYFSAPAMAGRQDRSDHPARVDARLSKLL
jgi:hypothetical protein